MCRSFELSVKGRGLGIGGDPSPNRKEIMCFPDGGTKCELQSIRSCPERTKPRMFVLSVRYI